MELRFLYKVSFLIFLPLLGYSNTYFVATTGNDTNDGSIGNPWRTIEYSLNQLSAGDTLNIREGIYYENTFTVGLQGTSTDPVVIQNYQDEPVTINGGVDDFLNAPNSMWTLVDTDINMYKSNISVAGDFILSWFPDDSIQIIEYEDTVNLKSQNYGPVNGFDPIYQGPGVYLRDDGYLYIRLEQNPNDLYDVDSNAIVGKPVDIDPNHNNIYAYNSKVLFYLDNAKSLRFKGISFYYSKYLFDVRNGSNDIKFDSCSFRYGNTGFIIREASDFDITNCDFDNGLPQNVYWTDVKNRAYEVAEPYPEFQSKAVSGILIDFNINNCYFHDGFDAVGVKDSSSNTGIKNNYFVRFRDDAIDLRAGISQIEISHNILWSIGSGISMTETADSIPGQVYIHHNVIDNSIRQHGGREGNYRENNWPIWAVIDPFGSHGDDMEAWWKIYNNTIVSRKSGYNWTAAGPNAVLGNSEKFILNNIFLILDDRIVFRGDSAMSGSMYDGNVYWRFAPTTYPLLYHFGDGGNYDSLSEFKSNSGVDWEDAGLEENPILDTFAINNSGFDSIYIRERYRPRNIDMYTKGALYDTLNWPGTDSIYYRGALEPGVALWNGTNTDWDDCVNWSKGIVPDEAYKVIIPSNPEYGNFPVIGMPDTAKCYNLAAENNAFLTIHGILQVLK